jgi:hypothetical protein
VTARDALGAAADASDTLMSVNRSLWEDNDALRRRAESLRPNDVSLHRLPKLGRETEGLVSIVTDAQGNLAKSAECHGRLVSKVQGMLCL